MLMPNLSVLLAERRLTLSKVSQDTHISRTTLTALAGGGAKGIQFDTLNTLCQYLKVAPGDFFVYRPFDLSLALEGPWQRPAVAFTFLRAGAEEGRCAMTGEPLCQYVPGDPPRLERLCLRLSLAPDADPAGEPAALLRALPRGALAELESQLLTRYDALLDPALAPDDYSPEVRWPWQ